MRGVFTNKPSLEAVLTLVYLLEEGEGYAGRIHEATKGNSRNVGNCLLRLQRSGLAERYEQKSEKGPPRAMFRLNYIGREAAKSELQNLIYDYEYIDRPAFKIDFSEFRACVERLAFPDYET